MVDWHLLLYRIKGYVMKEIYLDNAATTKVDKMVADEVYKVMTKCFGNPSSRHSKGSEAANIISEARKSVSKLIYCEPENIIFTSGGTESNNLAILGSFNLKSNKNKNIVTSSVEHSSFSYFIVLYLLNKVILKIDFFNCHKTPLTTNNIYVILII